MSKKLKIILMSIGILILAGLGVGYLFYNQITDYVIANVFESLLLEDLTEQGLVDDKGNIALPTVSDLQEQPTEVATNDPASPATQPNEDTTQPGQEIGSTTEKDSLTSQGTPSSGNTPSNAGSSGQSQSITKQDMEQRIKDIVKGIPTREKNAVMRLVVQNVSSSDMRYLSGLVTDGNISGSDIAKAKEVALRSFSPEQLEDVKYYYYKYIGLFAEFY